MSEVRQLNLARMKARAQEIQERRANQGGGDLRFQNKIAVGETIIRILPPFNDDCELSFRLCKYYDLPDTDKAHTNFQLTYPELGLECPIAQVIDHLQEEYSVDVEYSLRWSAYVNVINRAQQETLYKQAKSGAITLDEFYTQLPLLVVQQRLPVTANDSLIIALGSPGIGDVTDLYEGRDAIINRVGSGQMDTKYTSNFSFETSPLLPPVVYPKGGKLYKKEIPEEVVQAVLAQNKDLAQIFAPNAKVVEIQEEYAAKLLEKYSPPNTGAGRAPEPPKKPAGKPAPKAPAKQLPKKGAGRPAPPAEEEVLEEEAEVDEGEDGAEVVEGEVETPKKPAGKLNLSGGKKPGLPPRPESVGSVAGRKISDTQKKKLFKRPTGSPTCYGDPETFDPEGSDMCKFCPYQETCGQTIADAS
jgi:hypothetical protein